MATFQTNLVINRTRCQSEFDGSPVTYTAALIIPIGTSIAQNDTIQIADVAALHTVTQMRIYTDDLDDGTTMTWNMGFLQLNPGTGYAGTNASGVAIDYDVPSATTYASPATNATYYQSAATWGRSAGWSSLTMANTTDVSGPGGPIRLAAVEAASTPTQSTASTTARTIRFEFVVAKTPPVTLNIVDRGGF